MKREQFRQLIHSIFATRDEEIGCAEFFDLLPRYADLRATGADAHAELPQVEHHLGQCPECNEVYEALLESIRSEEPPHLP
jgi:predicted anti-sigma-YlaC factor YlaD